MTIAQTKNVIIYIPKRPHPKSHELLNQRFPSQDLQVKQIPPLIQTSSVSISHNYDDWKKNHNHISPLFKRQAQEQETKDKIN